MKPALQAAINTIMQALGEYETRGASAQAGLPGDMEPDGDEAPGAGECPACAAGTCDNPEHMDEGSKAAMLKDLGA